MSRVLKGLASSQEIVEEIDARGLNCLLISTSNAATVFI
jgi:hypothetical protein